MRKYAGMGSDREIRGNVLMGYDGGVSARRGEST